MTIDALSLCLNVSLAHASLKRRLHEDLGAFHGLDYEDFLLLHLLLRAEHGRMPMADLAQTLGLPMSALVRKMVLLEKTGLAARTANPDDDTTRHAATRPGGSKLMHAAITTVEAVCADAVGSLDPACLPGFDTALRALRQVNAPHT